VRCVRGDNRVFVVVKRHKRCHIVNKESGVVVYTPPSFVRFPYRAALWSLADAFSSVGDRCINAIAEFESRWNERPQSKRS
jgi:hypothetical protein